MCFFGRRALPGYFCNAMQIIKHTKRTKKRSQEGLQRYV